MPIIILGFENLFQSFYLMAEIATHPYTKWQKSRPIPIPELKNYDPSKRHLHTRRFLGVNPLGNGPAYYLVIKCSGDNESFFRKLNSALAN